MATVNKDFKIKHGLVVEGTNATVNGQNILRETASDQYIINLVGGVAYISSVDSDDFTVTSGNLTIASGSDLARTGDITSALGDLTTDDIQEAVNAVNQYFTEFRAQTAVSNALGTGLTYGSQGAGNVFLVDENYIATRTYAEGVANTAQSNAESYTNNQLVAYTQTNDLDFTVGGYGYLKSADLPTMYSDSDVDAHLSGGDGINYSFGTISAHLGNGLEFSINGEIQIDENVVATQTDLSDAITAHNNLSDVHGVTGEVLGTTDTQTISNKTLGSDLAAGGFQITNLGTPQNSTDAATKAYVDAVSEGLHVHAAARVAIQGNISIATGLENGDTAGGVTLATGDRILVKDQTTASENGIYVVQASGQALRATDFDTATEVASGDFIFVSEGTYANTGWVQTNSPATIGTDPIAFVQFSGAGTYTAGNGLTLDGTEFKINESITATVTYVGTEIGDHASDTATHGVTEIVGTSENQTLTNKTLGSSTVLGANLDAANTYTVANLQEPVSNQDAATKYYVDTELSTGLNTKADAENPTITGSVTLSGSGDFTITSDSNIVLDANTTAYLESATAGNEIATQGYVDNAVDNVTIDLSTAAGANIDWNAGTSQFDVNVNDVITNGDIATNTSVANTYLAQADVDTTVGGLGYAKTVDLPTQYTDADALNAIRDANEIQPQAIDITWVRREEATWTDASTVDTYTAHSFGTNEGSVKYLVRVFNNGHSQVSEVLVTTDSNNNIAVLEYGTIYTSVDPLASITADYDGANSVYRLRVTTANSNSQILLAATMLHYND